MKKIFRLPLLIATTFLIGACNNTPTFNKETQLDTVTGYISTRYTNNYDYDNYCVFKPNNCHRLIDISMAESIEYQKEYLAEIKVENVTYEKTEDISQEEYSKFEIEGDPIVTKAERGVANYRWIITPNQTGIEDGIEPSDTNSSKNLTLVEIDSLWYVYITVH